jgi:urea ABC transporter ATP-binding protein UrtE
MLEVSALHAGYGGIPILGGISMTVTEGDVTGILGHNGMGKTTLLKTLIGLVPATGGSIRFLGHDITRAPVHQRNRLGIGYVPQGREIFPALSVRDNLRMGCAAAQVDENAAIERALDEFPRLAPLLDRLGGSLSGGEQQLLAIARCLCGEPKLVLLDEPTEGVQPSIIEELVETLQHLRAARGLTVVLVEQNLDFIAALSNTVLIIQKGRLVREVTPRQLDDPDLVGEFVGLSG